MLLSSPARDASPVSPDGGGSAASPDGEGLHEEEEEELEMHSKAFHAIGQLKAIRDRAAADRQR